jgi:hypothetical protein
MDNRGERWLAVESGNSVRPVQPKRGDTDRPRADDLEEDERAGFAQIRDYRVTLSPAPGRRQLADAEDILTDEREGANRWDENAGESA